MTARRLALLALLPLFALAVMAPSCGDDSDSPTGTSTTQVTATGGAASGTASGSTAQAREPTYDIKLSGGLTAEWKTGDGSSARCTLAADGFAALGVNGQIDGKPYGFGFDQGTFTAGTFTYPQSDTSGNTPFIQVATTTDSSVDWTASGTELGSGTATVSGARGSDVHVTVDLELTPRAGGIPVHVIGEIDCPTT